MRVYVYPADRAGCGYYRLIWPAQVLQAAGHDVKIIMPHERGSYLYADLNADGHVVGVGIPEDADVVVFQRISHRHLVEAVPIIRRRGVAVVVDIDDDLATIHPGNPAWHAFQGHQDSNHHWRNVVAACDAATLVTTSTRALTRYYAKHGRSTVIDNFVPERYLSIKHSDSQVIGWGGSLRSHPNDLQVLGTSMARLEREGINFRVVGPGALVDKILGLDSPVNETGALDIEESWPVGLAGLGIGIAPLADTRFNVSKSRLKMLELAAVGVPCVVSPRTEYLRLHKLGVGLMARKPSEWYRQLKRLHDSEDARIELSERGRTAVRNLTIEANGEIWWNAWTRAYEIEQGGASPALSASSRRQTRSVEVDNNLSALVPRERSQSDILGRSTG